MGEDTMPELPEVETVRRSLAQALTGRVITEAEVFHEGVIEGIQVPDFLKGIKGKTFLGTGRRGKYLIFEMSGPCSLVVHLRMTGRLIYCAPSLPLKKHTHVIFHLDDGYDLRFTDPRRFGRLWLLSREETGALPGLAKMGPEPFSPDFSVYSLKKELAGRKTKIKSFLLDQRHIAGIGNIYADEILFRCAIHPERDAGSLCDREVAQLYQETVETLQEAVTHRGTSFSDYVDGWGEKGTYQNKIRVYQKNGARCPRCGAVIERLKVGSRSAYHCPACQK